MDTDDGTQSQTAGSASDPDPDAYSTDSASPYIPTLMTEGITKGVSVGEYLPDTKPRRIVYAALGNPGNVLLQRVSVYTKDGSNVKGNPGI